MSNDWTNPSVLRFAGDRNPVDAITDRARNLVLDMLEQGWPGPPFDPIWVANRLGAEVVPVADAEDARTVTSPGDKLGVRIEYNPARPQSRRRFSLAHEVGHLLFEDVAEATRNRAKVDRGGTDDWQLELLCNLAAAEIAMPIGSVEDLLEGRPRMQDVVALRERLNVSREALLLRIARQTTYPLLTFAASRVSPTDAEPLRLDYAVASRTWQSGTPTRGTIPSTGISDCTAIGYSSTARDVIWPGVRDALSLDCIGVPPFPGHRWPRVLGFLYAGDGGIASRLRFVFGDATKPMGKPPWLIAHIVNDRARVWHGRFATALRKRYPRAQSEYVTYFTRSRPPLGSVVYTQPAEQLTVASLVAQAGYGASKRSRLRYVALREALAAVATRAADLQATVHLPRIGTGEARGHWSVIEALIDDELVARGIDVTVYDPPNARRLPDQGELAL